MTTYESAQAPVPFSTLLARVAGQLLAGLARRVADARRIRRRSRDLRRALLRYRGIDERMLEDFGLSTAIVEAALAGEDWAVRAFVDWFGKRRN